MIKDLPENNVSNIGVAVVLEEESATDKLWSVYLLNLKDQNLTNVLVSSKGYGIKDGERVSTSILRHSIGDLPAGDFALIEPIPDELFALTNEYWLSFYIDNVIYDKKY